MAVRRIQGAVVLSSAEAVKYYDELASNGMLLETISLLIERAANGEDLISMSSKLDEILSKLGELKSSGIVSSSQVISSTPEEIRPTKAAVKTIEVGGKKSGSIISRFGSMRRD